MLLEVNPVDSLLLPGSLLLVTLLLLLFADEVVDELDEAVVSR